MKKKIKKIFELKGECRKKAINDCLRQIKSWGLRMPAEPPMIRHFGLNDFYNTGEIEFWICNNTAEGYCGKFIFLFSGQTCPRHFHRIKHETFFVLRGKIKLNLRGKNINLDAGRVAAIPLESGHYFTAISGPALVLEISKPSLHRDSYFDNTKIGIF